MICTLPVYNWCLSSDATSASNFVSMLEGLVPPATRQPSVKDTKVHRRAIVGTAGTFEVLACLFYEESTGCEKVALLTPFVSGETNGISMVGLLVWAVVPDTEASLYKTLISNTEFMRNKVKMDDRFLAHHESVLELGRDVSSLVIVALFGKLGASHIAQYSLIHEDASIRS